ncbi:MAG TPA: DUF423 domain-containing protein [Caulobacterales bacterium]|nr:DUF423 domain-containing protein [Caulobacterales bacterium]
MPFRHQAFFAALLGALAVAFGAFAAHGIADPKAAELVRRGAQYHMAHVLAAFAALAMWRWGAARARFVAPILFAGICLFSGSLYALALGAPRWAGLITPIGGALFVVGWGVLACAALGLPKRPD